MLLDSRKELGLLLLHLWLPSSIHRIEYRRSNGRSKQPSQSRSRKSQKSQCQERIQRNLSDNRLGKTTSEYDSSGSTTNETIGDGEDELITTTLETKLEEGVPIKGGMSIGGFGRNLLRVRPRKRLGYRSREALLTQRRRSREAQGSDCREGGFRDEAGGATGGRGGGGGLARVAQDERLERGCHG